MSQRVYINKHQLFGNNDYFPEWNDFIKSQGIEINEDGCYKGYIKDFNGAMKVVEGLVRAKINQQHQRVLHKEVDFNDRPHRELFDLADFETCGAFSESTPLHYKINEMVENWYPFLTYQLLNHCRDKIMPKENYTHYEITDPKGILVECY